MNDFTILHLSDLHIDEAKGRPNILLKNLLVDIKSEMRYSENIIVVVTGDLVNRAKYENGERVVEFFQNLNDYLGDKVKHIHIVPGNHDKVRGDLDEIVLSSFEDCEIEDCKNSWKYVKAGFEEYLDLTERIYQIFYKEDAHSRVLRDTFGVNTDKIGETNICVIQFNTAWLSKGDQDQRKLKIGDFQLQKIKEELIEKYEELEDNKEIALTIAVAHHPVNWLSGEEEDRIQQELLSPNGLNAKVYICGHTHNRDVVNWQNNRTSLTTLVSGIGWPDGSTSHPYAHTYFSYVFNLDVNSIDVYVRSSDDAYTFEPDFRIYTNIRNKENGKIIIPIDICQMQPYFHLGAPINRSAKGCIFTREIIQNLKHYDEIFTICEDRLRDRLESIKYDAENEIEEWCEDKDILEYLKKCWFYGQENKVGMNLDDRIRKIFMDHFSNYLEAICKIVIESIKELYPAAILRTHFRCLDLENDKYDQIALYGYCSKPYTMAPLPWGQLIEQAYKSGCPLIASVNRQYCDESMKKNEEKQETEKKWTDFITAIPRFSNNAYIEKDPLTEKIEKERPYLSFGVTVYRKEDRMILYMLDYHQIHWFIGRQILKYLKYFPVELEQYIAYRKFGKGELENGRSDTSGQ